MFDEAEVLLVAYFLQHFLLITFVKGIFGQRPAGSGSSTDRYATVDTVRHLQVSIVDINELYWQGLLLYHMDRFPGVVILTTNMLNNIDTAFFRRFKYVMEFPIPTPQLRVKLWRTHIPTGILITLT